MLDLLGAEIMRKSLKVASSVHKPAGSKKLVFEAGSKNPTGSIAPIWDSCWSCMPYACVQHAFCGQRSAQQPLTQLQKQSMSMHQTLTQIELTQVQCHEERRHPECCQAPQTHPRKAWPGHQLQSDSLQKPWCKRSLSLSLSPQILRKELLGPTYEPVLPESHPKWSRIQMNLAKSLTTIARTMNNIHFPRKYIQSLWHSRPNPRIWASSCHLAFPFHHPYGWQRKKVLCHLSQPGIQLTSQHLAKYHRPRCVDLCFPLITLLVALHLPSHFENICQLECSEAVK